MFLYILRGFCVPFYRKYALRLQRIEQENMQLSLYSYYGKRLKHCKIIFSFSLFFIMLLKLKRLNVLISTAILLLRNNDTIFYNDV